MLAGSILNKKTFNRLREAELLISDHLLRKYWSLHFTLLSPTKLYRRIRPDGTRIYANKAYLRYYRISPEQAIGGQSGAAVIDADKPRWDARLQALTPDNPTVEAEVRVINGKGEERWQHWIDTGIFDANGNLVEVHGVGRDVTDLKRAEEALKNSERYLYEKRRIDVIDVDIAYLKEIEKQFSELRSQSLSVINGFPILGQGPVRDGKSALNESNRTRKQLTRLTGRQQDVLALIAKGFSNKRIAYELGLAEGTVKLHVAAVLKALDVKNRTQAVLVATAHGLLGGQLID